MMQLLGSLFVLIIFIASYAAFGNFNPSNQVSTTTIPKTIAAFGSANAVISGYGNTASISIACNENRTENELTQLLQQLEGNGSINSYYSPSANLTLIYLNKMNPLQLSNYLSRSMNQSLFKCISISSSVKLTLPETINFEVGPQLYSINVPSSFRNVSANLHISNETYVRVRVLALLTENGSIYNMNVST